MTALCGSISLGTDLFLSLSLSVLRATSLTAKGANGE